MSNDTIGRREQKAFAVEFGGGITIVRAKTIAKARRWADDELGRMNGPYSVAEATQDQVNWVTAMGGRIHEA